MPTYTVKMASKCTVYDNLKRKNISKIQSYMQYFQNNSKNIEFKNNDGQQFKAFE